MIDITTKKIGGLTPRWAPFPGFSLLFDPPESSFLRQDGLEILSGNWLEDSDGKLFYLAAQSLQKLGTDYLLQKFGFCALPFPSYHVTAFDVANVGDLSRCREEIRESLTCTLDALPSCASVEAGFLNLAAVSSIVAAKWDLSFGYGRLRRWGSVLAIELTPLQVSNFRAFCEARAVLSQSYEEKYGVGAEDSFTPHLSVGYFLNREASDLAASMMSEWDDLFRNAIGEATVEFQTASLYGFTDMATFFRPHTSR